MSLPFLGDDIFVLIAAELDACMLGRLGCTAQRFWRASVPDPAHKGSALPELWSVAEEGARRRLAAQSEQVRGWVCRGGVGGSWLRALGEAEKLRRPLHWTAHCETLTLTRRAPSLYVPRPPPPRRPRQRVGGAAGPAQGGRRDCAAAPLHPLLPVQAAADAMRVSQGLLLDLDAATVRCGSTACVRASWSAPA